MILLFYSGSLSPVKRCINLKLCVERRLTYNTSNKKNGAGSDEFKSFRPSQRNIPGYSFSRTNFCDQHVRRINKLSATANVGLCLLLGLVAVAAASRKLKVLYEADVIDFEQKNVLEI